MNDVYFFSQMVMPAVKEFLRHPGDIRLGTQACTALQSMADHYFRHNEPDPTKIGNCTSREQFRAEFRKGDWATCQVMQVANGTRHAKQAFFDLHGQAPAICGVMRADFPLSQEPYVFVDDDNAWLLCDLVEHVASRWKARLGLT